MAALNCPRCRLPMTVEKYEGVTVDDCRECWGYWLDRGEFAKIASSRRLVFSEEEREQLIAAAVCDAERQPARRDEPIQCPHCGKTMEKVHFNVDAPITLDRCADHGVWFDTRELKLAQILTEKASAVRKLFFMKLKEGY